MCDQPTLYCEEALRDPYPIYERMRRISSVYWDDPAHAWCVLDADLIMQVLKDNEVFTSNHLIQRAEPVLGAQVLAQMEGHEHDQKKNVALRAIAAVAMDGYYLPAVEKVCETLLKEVQDRRVFDFVGSVASPFSIRVTCQLLGIERNWEQRIVPWNRSIVEFITLLQQSETEKTRRLRQAGFFRAFMTRMVEARRARPRQDLVSYLATNGPDFGLSDPEIVALSLNILLAASEPLDKTLSYMVFEALSHPMTMNAVRGNPSQLPAFVAETLRLHPPVQIIPRVCATETSLGTVQVKPGQTVYCLVGAAHRDPKKYSRPNNFDIGRVENDVRKAFAPLASHIAFGHGIHFCIGAMLARRQREAALRTCLPFMETWKLNDDALVEHGLYTRGPTQLLLKNGVA